MSPQTRRQEANKEANVHKPFTSSSLSTPPSATHTLLSAHNSSPPGGGRLNQSSRPTSPSQRSSVCWRSLALSETSSLSETPSFSETPFLLRRSSRQPPPSLRRPLTQHSSSFTLHTLSYSSMNTSAFMTGQAICNLKDRFMNVKNLLQQLTDSITVHQQNQVQQSRSQSSVVSIMISVISRMQYRKPSVYNGSEDLRYWLLNMKEDFEREPDYFTQDKNKVTYATCNLKEDLTIKRRWQLTKLRETDPAITNWALFRSWLQTFYRVMNLTVSAENALIQLKYRNEQSMQEFVNEFEALLNDIAWDDGAVAAAFRSKLPAGILSRIVTENFLKLSDSYAAYKEAALQAEFNIVLVDAQRTRSEGPLRKRQRTFNNRQSSANAVSLSERQNPSTTFKWGRLTAEERERREKYNLCWYCDKLNHQLQNCSEWPKAGNEGLWS